ncbi:MAG: DNA-processing protein DprA [Gemmataceae bacterium]
MAAPLSPELRDLLALTLVPGLGPKITAALLAHFGSAATVRIASEEHLRRVPMIGDKLARQFAEALRTLDVQAEIGLLEKYQVELLPVGDSRYPTALAETIGRPPLLYFRGTLSEADVRAVAVVGSRHCTSYGKRMATNIAGGLARAGVTVVSGLARGIDGAAHRGALEAGGRTIAVLAGGLSEIYPPEHAALADAVAKAGCLLTETPMTVSPQPGMFPARNRIISGVSLGVVIVEAGEQSGALITARHAADQGREVFVVPANADSAASAGTLRLLRDGARLVRDADDVLEDLAGLSRVEPRPAAPTAAAPSVPPGLDDNQRRVWELLADGPKHVDELVRAAGIPVASLNGLLMVLEMKKVVRRLPGNMYERFTR